MGIRILARSLLLATAIALHAQGADAQDTTAPQWDDSYYPFAREGLYFGFGALYALENYDTNPPVKVPGASQSVSGEDGGGLGLRVGYRLHPRIASEFLFQYYWGFEVRARSGTAVSRDEFDGWSMTANAKLYPLLGRFQPYAVAGLGGLVFENKRDDDAGFLARIGGGLDVYITDRFVVDLEAVYLFPGGDISEFQFATFQAGVQYRY